MQDPNATFDVRKFYWIGNPINGVSTIGIWAETGVRTLEDARKRELTVGATGPNVRCNTRSPSTNCSEPNSR